MGKNPKYGTFQNDQNKIYQWNRTVNVFRRIAGLEPFPESDEESSTSQTPEVDNSPE